jgi:hypothetical protein
MGRRVIAATAACASSLSCVGFAFALPPFTSAPKFSARSGTTQAEAFSLRVGCHAAFDRVVVRVRFATPAYDVRYASRIVTPSGKPLSLPGTARLRVALRPARGHTAGGTALLPSAITAGCANLRTVKVAEDFEGVLVLGVGLNRQRAFRVFELTAPSRLVIDVAH